jgi:hypothetical protein
MIVNQFFQKCVLVVSAPLTYTKAENLQHAMELDLDIKETAYLIDVFDRIPNAEIYLVGIEHLVAALKQYEPKGTIFMLRRIPQGVWDDMERAIFQYADTSGNVVLCKVAEQPAPDLNYALPT